MSNNSDKSTDKSNTDEKRQKTELSGLVLNYRISRTEAAS